MQASKLCCALLGLGAAMAASAWAAPPSLEEWQRKTQLPEELTLTYQVVEKDVRSPEALARAQSYDRMLIENAKRADPGRDPREIEREMKGLVVSDERQAPPLTYRITLSTHAGKLYYRMETPKGPLVLIFDGKATYEIPSFNQQLLISPGLAFDRMWAFPLPAASITHVPILKGPLEQLTRQGSEWKLASKTPIHLRTGGDSLPFDRCVMRARLDGSGVKLLTNVVRNGDGTPFESWDYPEHRRFAGRWLASRIRLRTYIELSDSKGKDRKNFARRLFDYSLVKATTHPVSAEQFDPRHWLKKGYEIVDQRPGGLSFIYEGEPGTLEQLIAAARRKLKEESNQTNTGVPGVLFLGITCVGTGGAWWWARRRTCQPEQDA
jgi:hypothetical protein